MEYVLALNRFFDLATEAPKEFFGRFLAHLHNHFIPHYRNNYHPYIFSHRLASLLAALLVTFKLFAVMYISLPSARPAFSLAITPENIVALTNESRIAFGLRALKVNPLLSRAAQAKAEDMAQREYFAHNSPDGKRPWDFLRGAGYNYIMAGENLAVNFSAAESVSEAWMNSPAHKANILNKNFEEIGVGFALGRYGGKTSAFVVQMFGVPAEEKIILKDPSPRAGADSLTIERFALMPADGDELLLTVAVSDQAVKVLAVYGQKARMLYPKGGNLWQTALSASTLASGREKLVVRAWDIHGVFTEEPLANFTDNLQANYNVFKPQGEVAGKSITVLGEEVNLESFERRFYLLFATVILTALIATIAVKRHIQHLSAIVNGAFLAMLAMLLWTG